MDKVTKTYIISFSVVIFFLLVALGFALFGGKKQGINQSDMDKFMQVYQARYDSLSNAKSKEISAISEQLDSANATRIRLSNTYEKEAESLRRKIVELERRTYDKIDYTDSSLVAIHGRLSD